MNSEYCKYCRSKKWIKDNKDKVYCSDLYMDKYVCELRDIKTDKILSLVERRKDSLLSKPW